MDGDGTFRIDAETIRTYREDGAAAVRGVFDREWIAVLREGVEAAIAAPGPVAKDYAAEGEGSFFTDHHMFLRFEPFRRFLFDSPAAAIAAALTGSRTICLYDEHLLIKEPGTVNPTYWHHDLPYFRIRGDQICSLWVPLDPVTVETGAMRFVTGSHRWGKYFQPIRIGLGEVAEGAQEFDGPAPDIDADPDRYPTVCYELEPGDCVAFHGLTLHSARGNSSPTARRRAVAYRFTGDDITWQPGAYTPIGLNPPGLVEGGPIECDQFPRILPRDGGATPGR